jgi:hypothetical protein
MDLKGIGFTTMDDIKSNATVELRKFQKKLSAGASNSGKVDGASECMRRGSTLKVFFEILEGTYRRMV